MSEPIPPAGDVRGWLAEATAAPFALAYADAAAVDDPVDWPPASAPRVGETGIVRAADGAVRGEFLEACPNRSEALRRWLVLDDGQRPLAILGVDGDQVREYTPGALAAELTAEKAVDIVALASWLGGWLYRRSTQKPAAFQLGWVVAAAAWACHLQAFDGHPPAAALTHALSVTGENDPATRKLVDDVCVRLHWLLGQLQTARRSTTDLAGDWHELDQRAGDVPGLRRSADWLLDRLALRDVTAQKLRAFLEPDLSDHVGRLGDGVPATAVDEPRRTHAAQARDTVRAYTAARYSGRDGEATLIEAAFPIRLRDAPATTATPSWHRYSPTARAAVADLMARLERFEATGAEPDEVNAEIHYLLTREQQLRLMHDVIGQLAEAAALPDSVPPALAAVAASQLQRRAIEAYGSLTRAGEALDGQIGFLHSSPHPGTATAAQLAYLQQARRGLGPEQSTLWLPEETDIQRRVEQAMAGTQHGPRRVREGSERQARPAAHPPQPRALAADPPGRGLQP